MRKRSHSEITVQAEIMIGRRALTEGDCATVVLSSVVEPRDTWRPTVWSFVCISSISLSLASICASRSVSDSRNLSEGFRSTQKRRFKLTVWRTACCEHLNIWKQKQTFKPPKEKCETCTGTLIGFPNSCARIFSSSFYLEADLWEYTSSSGCSCNL